MSVIKSFSVGNGDMFYIKHESDNFTIIPTFFEKIRIRNDTDNFTIIDCNLIDDVKNDILDEIDNQRKGKGIQRFITTHPDDDHIHCLKELNERIGILNFYCVKNNIDSDGSIDFNIVNSERVSMLFTLKRDVLGNG